jgi:putative phage-type endonuclease
MFSKEQLVARQKGFGASESAAILGLSNYASPLDVYLSKIIEPTERPDTPQTKRGRRFEPVVLDIYEDEHGAIDRNLGTFTSKKYPFMFASLDGSRQDDGRPVEAKTAGQFMAKNWGEAETDQVPESYLIQLCHQMIVAEKEIGDIAALITLDDFRKYTIALDPELAQMIIEALATFWKRVENREPPAPTTGYEAEQLYRKSVAVGIEADMETAAKYFDLIQTRHEIKPLTEKEEALISDIKLFLGEKDTLLIESKPMVSWKSSKSGTRFDAARFQRERPEIAKEYLIQTEGSRRFLIKGEK